MSQVLIDNGNWDPSERIANALEPAVGNQSLNSSNLSEKQDSGIEGN